LEVPALDYGDCLWQQFPWGENVMTVVIPAVPPATEGDLAVD